MTTRSLTAMLCLAVSAACGRSETPETATPGDGIGIDTVATGLESPVHLASPPGDTARIFVVEQAGRIRLINNGVLVPEPWLDITDRVGSGGERGLLSLAFHPRFAETGLLYVNYTERDGGTRISRFSADPAADTVPAASEVVILRLEQPWANHNGGHILFGPDGMLYAGTGDGGGAGDPGNNASDSRSLLGKLLRFDVDGAARPEIRAFGLRNPWRMAFDTAAGLLWIADVGQNRWEEINAVPDTATGLDFGWRRMEGSHCFLLPTCRKSGTVLPVHEYGHDLGCSVTGGVVYRGRAIPRLAGHYLFSDYCGGWLRSFRLVDGAAVDLTSWGLQLGMVTSFGEDARGEVYVMNTAGRVYRLAPRR